MRKLFLLLMAVIACYWTSDALAKTISGTVVEAPDNEPVIGASVLPVGGAAGMGVATDMDGNFTMSVPDNVKQIKVTYVGCKPVTVAAGTNLRIVLQPEAQQLQEQVVVAYGTASKESLTGSVAVVGSKEIEDRPVTTVTAALEGNAPGVQVNNSYGTPGSSPSIVIRGFNTVNGSTTPLYIVDGIPYDGSLNDINPADVESMSVLKDAASSALYGAKGANGVVLITTKKAKKAGKVDVTASIGLGLFQRGLPRYETMGANEWMNTSFQSVLNGNVMHDKNNQGRDYWMNYVRNNFITNYAKENIYGVPESELFNEFGVLNDGLAPLAGYTDLDWWDSIKQTGFRQEYNINAAGATDKFNVFASIGYMKEQGYMIKSDFERFSGRLNANYNPTSYLKFGVNLFAANQKQNSNTNTNDGSTEDPFNVFNKAPIYPYYQHDAATGAILYDDKGQPLWNTAAYLKNSNPGYTQRLDFQDMNALLVDGNVYGTAVLPYGFELTVRGSMHRDKTIENLYQNSTYGSGSASNGAMIHADSQFGSHTFMQQLNWSQDYGMHHVDVLLDHENYNVNSETSSVYFSNETFPGIYNLSNFTEYQNRGGSIVQERSESYLARARYDYAQRYFLEASIRRDGSSRFAKDHRWGTFWSIGGTWIISKEKFMESLPWVNYAKLRASYGSVGNNASAGTYAYWTTYAQMAPFNGTALIMPAQLALNNTRWEATKTFDLGLEGSILDSRLNFTIGYFYKRNTDLLFNVYMPYSLGSMASSIQEYSGGLTTVLDNIGTMQNYGWELSFNGDIIRNADLKWSASIDATFLKNKVIKLPGGNDILSASRAIKEGEALQSWYLYEWAGVDMTDGSPLVWINPNAYQLEHDYPDVKKREEAFQKNLQEADKAGCLRKIGDKYYTTQSQYAYKDIVASPLPTVYGSFGTNLTWKGFNLGLLFTYSLGGKTYDSNYAGYMNAGSQPGAIHKDLAGAWTAADAVAADAPNRINADGIPVLDSQALETGGTSTRWLTSSDYLVFKNLNVSYTFPKKWTSPLQLQGLTLGMSVDNLFTVTARKGMNPQQSWFGSQQETFVTARVFSFNLTARF